MTIADTGASFSNVPNFVELDRESQSCLANECPTSALWFALHADRVLYSPLSENPREQIEVLLRFVLWNYKEGQFEKGLQFALKAVRIARQIAALALLRRALNLLALIYSRLGNVPESTICYIEALHITEDIGDRTGKASTLVNLAELRLGAGMISESIALNRYVIQLIQDDVQFFQMSAAAHHNLAAASLLLGDLEIAMDEIRKAKAWEAYQTNDFFIHQSVVADATECKILLRANRLSEARASAARAQQRASLTSSRSALINASLAVALCDAAEGKTDTAFGTLELIRKRVAADEPLYRDFLEVEAMCNDRAGNTNHAQHLWKRHLTHLAAFQRRSAIRQVAAIQRQIRRDAIPPQPSTSSDANWYLASYGRPSSLREMLESVASVADLREGLGAHHNHRVGKVVELFGLSLGYANNDASQLGTAARLHDIGKLAIPDALLLKHGTLAPAELEIVRRHTQEGSQILMDIMATVEQTAGDGSIKDWLRIAAEISLNHHEFWDGSGYPRGIGGSKIPESARLVTLADVFDDLITPKRYRPPASVSCALATMRSQIGRQFDSDLFSRFESLIAELRLKYGSELEGFAQEEDDLSVYQRAYLVIDQISSFTKLPSTTGEVRKGVPTTLNECRQEA